MLLEINGKKLTFADYLSIIYTKLTIDKKIKE